MRESYWSRETEPSEHEIFSQLQVPPEAPFFVRLDGRRFQTISEMVGAEKPFDEGFARCLVASARAIFQGNLNPALVYVASDEINVLFVYTAPFRRRVEKIDSILAGIASSTFSLSILKLFKKPITSAFDSRIILSSPERIVEYLTWRQRDAWRNHNNAYAYWHLRKMGSKPLEAAKMLRGLKTKDLHEMLFRHGVNLAQTPAWQRRGILIYREPYQKKVKNHVVTRWRIGEEWNLPTFSSTEGQALIQRVLDWAKPI
ncbi:MAG: tRNAHis guanylyltransferase [Candidatus Bathyarchaeota archaeon BA1]|nr:MAG: tRNAHis guanylyltransferase [Candidatus Bathyarchaeota archaeon BA1]